MNKVIVVLGPTSSGKTSLAINLAKKFNGEIICADSRSVYKGLDIGTAKPYIDKPVKKSNLVGYPSFDPVYEIDGVVHYALDIADPKDNYSVAEFQKLSYSLIKNIITRGKIPFLVGGTGLYIDAVTQGFQFPKEDLKIREEVEKLSDKDLINKLKKIDSETLKKYKNNRRRLVRALEVYLVNKKPISAYTKNHPPYEFLYLAIDWPRSELYSRIDKWVDERLKMGLIEEVKKLHNAGLSYDRLEQFGLEYRYISKYLKNPTDDNLKLEICNLKFKIHAFARRQYTWFRRNKEIHWLSSDKNVNNEAKKIVEAYLK